jgi:hypothetical protein
MPDVNDWAALGQTFVVIAVVWLVYLYLQNRTRRRQDEARWDRARAEAERERHNTEARKAASAQARRERRETAAWEAERNREETESAEREQELVAEYQARREGRGARRKSQGGGRGRHYDPSDPDDLAALIGSGLIWNPAVSVEYKQMAVATLVEGHVPYNERIPASALIEINRRRSARGMPPVGPEDVG